MDQGAQEEIAQSNFPIPCIPKVLLDTVCDHHQESQDYSSLTGLSQGLGWYPSPVSQRDWGCGHHPGYGISAHLEGWWHFSRAQAV